MPTSESKAGNRHAGNGVINILFIIQVDETMVSGAAGRLLVIGGFPASLGNFAQKA